MSSPTEHVMLDLETMGTGSRAAIRAIGAVFFDPSGVHLDRSLYLRVDLQSCVDAGLEVDVDTFLWWLGQNDAARAEMRAPGGVHLAEALREFSKFTEFTGGRDILLWGNGAAFDNVILASAYRALRLTPPWKFYNDRCYRTMKAAYSDVKMPRTGTHHNALDDAISQANHLIEIWKAARGLLV